MTATGDTEGHISHRERGTEYNEKVTFYDPMSPATHVLEWFAAHAKELSICVRQVEARLGCVHIHLDDLRLLGER